MHDFEDEDAGRRATQKARETAEKGRQAAEETSRGVEQSYLTTFDNMQKARETAEKGRQAAEETARGVEQSYSTTFDNIRNLNVSLIDAAQANADAMCALARDIVTIKTPSDLLTVWMNHAQKQFDMATKQASELTALGLKFRTESTAPMTRSFQQAFTQGTT
ncbi:MAG TPA: phasin family protein [Xanthobacteraceae bacterium]|jgi:hypothetical protein